MTTGTPHSGDGPQAVPSRPRCSAPDLLAAATEAPKQWYECLDELEAVLERP